MFRMCCISKIVDCATSQFNHRIAFAHLRRAHRDEHADGNRAAKCGWLKEKVKPPSDSLRPMPKGWRTFGTATLSSPVCKIYTHPVPNRWGEGGPDSSGS